MQSKETTEIRSETAPGLDPPSRTGKLSGLFLKSVGFSVWASFLLLCAGISVAVGLCCADDSYCAVVAKNIVTGIGYATTWGDPADSGQPIPFHPEINTGPALILPCALLVKLLGVSEIIPGLTAILLWGGLLTAVLIRVNRYTDGLSFLLGVSTLCITILAQQLRYWPVFLGEATAAALLIMGHWLVAAEKLSWRTLFLAGALLGLAVQTKYLALLGTVGAFLILVIRLHPVSQSPKTWLQHCGIFVFGCVLPTLIFEGFKLSQLGLHNYIDNWRQFLVFFRYQAIKLQAGQSLFEVASQRFALIPTYFFIDPAALIILVAVLLCLSKSQITEKWSLLFAGLVVSICALGIYWLTLSTGWQRYLAIAVALATFALSVPLFGLCRLRERLLFAALTYVLVARGITQIPYSGLTNVADNGLFKPSKDRIARAGVVARIQELKREGPLHLAAMQWASFVDVEFNLEGSTNFKRIDTIKDLPGRKIVLINHHFTNENTDIIREVRARTTAVLFSKGPYELLEIK